jgi:hypothetical protein
MTHPPRSQRIAGNNHKRREIRPVPPTTKRDTEQTPEQATHAAGALRICVQSYEPNLTFPVVPTFDAYRKLARWATERADLQGERLPEPLEMPAPAAEPLSELHKLVRKHCIKHSECAECGKSWLFPFGEDYPEEHEPGCLVALPTNHADRPQPERVATAIPTDAMQAVVRALRFVAELEEEKLPESVFRVVDQALEMIDTPNESDAAGHQRSGYQRDCR